MKGKGLKQTSVVIPSKDGSQTIRRALDSVALNSAFVKEVIVVFSNSPEDFKRFCRNDLMKYAAYFDLRFIDSGQSSNGSIARNAGIAVAGGLYLALLDDDDEWMADKLLRYMNYIDEHQLQGSFVLFSRVISCTEEFANVILFPGAAYNGEPIADFVLSPLGGAQTSSMLLPVDLAQRVGFDDSLLRHQDYDFCIRLEEYGAKFYEIKEPLSYWYQRGDSVSKGATLKFCIDWIGRNEARVSRIAYVGYVEKEIFRAARRTKRLKEYFSFACQQLKLRELVDVAYRTWLRAVRSACGRISPLALRRAALLRAVVGIDDVAYDRIKKAMR